MFLGDWLQRRAMLSPNIVALVEAVNEDQPITYITWNDRLNRLANFLQAELSICKGERMET